tara:strand:+ start:226 stop:903 length:678 start_codon:yes stop_codon:yes gene_type:complete
MMPEDLHLERLQKQIPALCGTVTGGVATVKGDDYVQLSNVGGVIQYLYDGYIDIQGWTTMRDNTFYPQMSVVQRSSQYGMSAAENGLDSMYDLLFILPRQLTSEEITKMQAISIPGFISGTLPAYYESNGVDLQHLMFGQWNLAATNSTQAPLCNVIDSDKFGSGEPTLANRLWVYRFCSLQQTNATGFTFPPLNLFIEGAFGKEGNREYMERLRRTFVLAADLE